MIATTATISISIAITITIAIICIGPARNAQTYTHNRWEAGSRFRWKILVGDLFSPRSYCLLFLQNLKLHLSTP
jgi:hypothetical protein